eukprot:GHVH01000147.1.p1 GENE.GHVH01000147.1~~GHVH01000147.1.p1  ORF type:complete len:483 (+),score=63.38 GHVH01000147.1:196-1644(+)
MRKKDIHDAARQIEVMLQDHYYSGMRSQLTALIGDSFPLHLQLPFMEAFSIYDKKYCVSKRTHILISTDEVRQILNIATVVSLVRGTSSRHASSTSISVQPTINNHVGLITFDGDGTLYEDGENFSSPAIAEQLCTFLRYGIHIALVTAASYGYEVDKYQTRIAFLINFFQERKLEMTGELGRFFVFGGECNYLMELNDKFELAAVPESLWVHHHSHIAKANAIQSKVLLDLVEATMRQAEQDLSLRTTVVRKERGVGLISAGTIDRCDFPNTGRSGLHRVKTEILDEVVGRCRQQIKDSGIRLTHCLFNGGSDVWCDMGDKAIGCTILSKLLHVEHYRVVHIGDQFDDNGNDLAARRVVPTIFITDPQETRAVLSALMQQLEGLTSVYTSETQRISALCMSRISTMPTADPILDSPKVNSVSHPATFDHEPSPSERIQSRKHMLTVANIMLEDVEDWKDSEDDSDSTYRSNRGQNEPSYPS